MYSEKILVALQKNTLLEVGKKLQEDEADVTHVEALGLLLQALIVLLELPEGVHYFLHRLELKNRAGDAVELTLKMNKMFLFLASHQLSDGQVKVLKHYFSSKINAYGIIHKLWDKLAEVHPKGRSFLSLHSVSQEKPHRVTSAYALELTSWHNKVVLQQAIAKALDLLRGNLHLTSELLYDPVEAKIISVQEQTKAKKNALEKLNLSKDDHILLMFFLLHPNEELSIKKFCELFPEMKSKDIFDVIDHFRVKISLFRRKLKKIDIDVEKYFIKVHSRGYAFISFSDIQEMSNEKAIHLAPNLYYLSHLGTLVDIHNEKVLVLGGPKKRILDHFTRFPNRSISIQELAQAVYGSTTRHDLRVTSTIIKTFFDTAQTDVKEFPSLKHIFSSPERGKYHLNTLS